jgi:DNA polymerase I-like protein with 3'-5' exonuclease and polymerase domains
MHDLYYDHGIVASLQVHDELDGSVADVEEARIYKRVMENCVLLEIPVVADVKLGPSWGNAKEEVELQ